jgi:hypothetical protein
MADIDTVAKHLNVTLTGKPKDQFKQVRTAMDNAGHRDKSLSAFAGELAAKKVEPVKAQPASTPFVPKLSTAEGPPLKGEVIAPTPNHHNRVDVAAPHITMNVPAPIVNVGHSEAPQWWQVVSSVKDAALYMVCGASAWALFGGKLLSVLRVAAL